MASAHSVAIESIIRSGDTTKLDELLEAHSSERQAIVDLCLFLATSNSNEKFTDFALNNGANPNATQQKGRRGITFPLLATITSGNPKPVIIQRLLTAKANPNLGDESGNTALLASCLRSFSTCVDSLLDGGADPNIKNEQGNTPLHMVGSRPGEFQGAAIVDALVARGADLFAQNNQGETPLLKTVRQGNVNAVQCLIAKVLSVANAAQLASTASNKGYTPVHEAAIWGRADLMKLLLDSKLFDVNAQDKEGNTPLHLAGDRKLGAMLLNEDPLGKVRVLLEHGALTNIKNAQGNTVTHLPHISQEFLDAIITKGKPDFTLDNASGDTPLICQVRAGKVFNAALIFKHLGPAVDIPSLVSIEDVDGDTILHKLAEVDEVDALSAILAGSSALLSRVNTSGMTMLDIAVKNRALLVLEHLLQVGAKVDPNKVMELRSDSGETVLHHAIKGLSRSIVAVAKALIDAGVDVNVETADVDEFMDGGQPIHIAAMTGNVEAIKFLVAVGAHVSSTASPTQDSPLHLAVRFSHQDAVLTLLQLGAKVDVVNMDGDDTIAEANLRSDWPILKLLEDALEVQKHNL